MHCNVLALILIISPGIFALESSASILGKFIIKKEINIKILEDFLNLNITLNLLRNFGFSVKLLND